MNGSVQIQEQRYAELLSARLKVQGDDAHHFETVGVYNNVAWINHSIATTVELTWLALRDVPGPLALIIGGIDRGHDHEKLKMFVKQKVPVVI
ncbi:MAG TPA: hypothetical protein VFU15_15215, partial [Bacteroidia bacterium]|nr:hypothetical protein [Bacteroidia bacterium]